MEIPIGSEAHEVEGEFWRRLRGDHDGHNRPPGACAGWEELVASHVRQVIIENSELRALLLQPPQALASRAGDVNCIPMSFQGAPEEYGACVAVLHDEDTERGLGHAAGEQVTHMGT
jgi:hypothetical protein